MKTLQERSPPRRAQATTGNRLGAYLKSRRTNLDPAALGVAGGRRRTAGLRREEVAQRANISPTWYTCLEQGRGGAPSADALERIAKALLLTDAEREHVFLLGLGRLPEVKYQRREGVTLRLQRVLDAFCAGEGSCCPALIRTATWDVVAWNRAATVMLTDYGRLAPDQRNILRMIFLDPGARRVQYDWDAVARAVVGMFRVDVARAGAADEVAALVEELSRKSADFAAMWQDSRITVPGEVVKRIRHPVLGPIAFEYSAFAVDGRADLTMVVYNPATAKDARKIRAAMGDVGRS